MAFPRPGSSYDAHRDWLMRLREEYDSLRSVASEGTVSGREEADAPAPALPRALQEDYQPTPRYGGQGAREQLVIQSMLALEVEDAPVYRGIGAQIAPHVDYGTPLAGSCFEGMDSMRARAASQGPDSVDQLWLSRMPPLITRQSAFMR